MNMSIMTRGLWHEWHVYFLINEFDENNFIWLFIKLNI